MGTMQRNPLVSIVIVTWNSKKYLSTCLNHLTQQTFQDFEVILVDNGSEDGALEGLQEKYPPEARNHFMESKAWHVPWDFTHIEQAQGNSERL